MKKIVISFLFCCSALVALSNAAMPGMWSSGHGGRFIPLFRADSVHLGKIQMQRELVLINLYPGFAAVKGEYWMMNTTDLPVTMRVGYPINGRYNADLVDHVMFRDLHHLKVMINDQPAHVVKAAEGYDSVYKAIDQLQIDNWYYFNCTFQPGQLTKITVYFLTNNNDAQLSRGYSRDRGNAFAYLLESGRAWAGKIESGQVLIRLNDGLSLDDFRGVYPVNTLYGDDEHLRFAFTNLEPDSSDNILLWYNIGGEDDFNFEIVSSKAGDYFRALDAFPVNEFDSRNLKLIDKDDFAPHNSGLRWLWWVLIGVLLLGLALLAFVIWLVLRLIRRKKKEKFT